MQLRELIVDIEAGRVPRRAVAILSAPTPCGCSEPGRWQPSDGYWRQLEFSVRAACAQRAVETVRFRLLQGDTQYMKTFHKTLDRANLRSLLVAGGAAVLLTILLAVPAYDASDLNTVIDNVRNWVAGLLATLATLFLTIGGPRYLTANGNLRAVEEGKTAIKSAMIGYALAALAPLLVSILQKVLAT